MNAKRIADAVPTQIYLLVGAVAVGIYLAWRASRGVSSAIDSAGETIKDLLTGGPKAEPIKELRSAPEADITRAEQWFVTKTARTYTISVAGVPGRNPGPRSWAIRSNGVAFDGGQVEAIDSTRVDVATLMRPAGSARMQLVVADPDGDNQYYPLSWDTDSF